MLRPRNPLYIVVWGFFFSDNAQKSRLTLYLEFTRAHVAGSPLLEAGGGTQAGGFNRLASYIVNT
jgi:hypothetical protein